MFVSPSDYKKERSACICCGGPLKTIQMRDVCLVRCSRHPGHYECQYDNERNVFTTMDIKRKIGMHYEVFSMQQNASEYSITIHYLRKVINCYRDKHLVQMPMRDVRLMTLREIKSLPNKFDTLFSIK